jgi:hypothetical protein
MIMTVREQSSLRHLAVWLEPMELCHPLVAATTLMAVRCIGLKIGNKAWQLSSMNLATATSTLNSSPSVTVGLGGAA